MATQPQLLTTFAPTKVVQPYFSGGPGLIGIDATGTLLVTAADDTAVLTDLMSGREYVRIEGDGEDLTAIALSPNGAFLATSSRSLMLSVYNIARAEASESQTGETTYTATRKLHKKQSTPTIVSTFDSTSTLLALGGADGITKVMDILGGYDTHIFRGHGGLVSALSFYNGAALRGTSLGRVRLLTGGDDTTVKVWDLERSKCIKTLNSHVSVVRGVDWSPDGERILSGGRDGSLVLYDVRSWKMVVTTVAEEVEACGFMAPGRCLRGDGGDSEKLVWAAGKSERVRVWDLVSGAELTAADPAQARRSEEDEEEKGIIQVIYHRGLHVLWSVHNDYTIQTHELRLPVPAVPSLPVTAQLTTNYDEIIDLRVLPGSDARLALATNSSAIRVVFADTFHDLAILSGHKDTVLSLDVDWSGRWLASAGKDSDVRLWDLSSNACAAVFTGHSETVAAVALPRAVPQPDSHAAEKKQSPKFILSGGVDRTIKKWDIDLGGKKQRAAYTRRAHEKDINAIALHPGDASFASASQDRTIKIWDTESGETLGVLRGHRRAVWSAQYAPGVNSSVLVSGSTDKTVRLWNTRDYTCTHTFEGHANSVQRVLWFNGGAQVASAGNEGLVKVWDVKTGESVATLDGHSHRIWALDTAEVPTEDINAKEEKPRTTTTLISADAAGVVTIWSDRTEETKAAETREEASRIEQSQALANHIHTGNHRAAITLALSLNHPGQLLSLLTTVTAASPSEPGSLSGSRAVDDVLASLADSQLAVLLCRIRDWNTNARTAPVAQRVLNVLVRRYGAKKLGGLRGAEGVWAVLEAYTVRHYKRVEELSEESWVVEFLLGQMDQVGAGALEQGMEIEVV